MGCLAEVQACAHGTSFPVYVALSEQDIQVSLVTKGPTLASVQMLPMLTSCNGTAERQVSVSSDQDSTVWGTANRCLCSVLGLSAEEPAWRRAAVPLGSEVPGERL